MPEPSAPSSLPPGGLLSGGTGGTTVFDLSEDRAVSPPAPTLNHGDEEAAAFVSDLAARVVREVHKSVQGQDEVIEAAMVALVAGGHALVEGVPGTAKTLLVRSIAAACQADFKRIQFTPDLMPSDISGTNVLDMATSVFHLRQGPVFTEILLADEINRTPPKTQAALLEAMEERRVSIDGETHSLPSVFTVFATQNPVEYEGTYPLPEAQLDRFLLKVNITYPDEAAEMAMLRAYDQGFQAANLATAGLEPVASVADLLRARTSLTGVAVEPRILSYVTTIVRRTRENRQLTLGASPRATVALLAASKALALIRGRPFLTPDDVKTMALPVLRHRILLRPEAEIEGSGPDRVLRGILEGVEVPR
ncbi:MAG: MoxR family ATPase [Cytophagales bacterium]|nr:MoxR family ATPase [Armatimonadota bacterium]